MAAPMRKLINQFCRLKSCSVRNIANTRSYSTAALRHVLRRVPKEDLERQYEVSTEEYKYVEQILPPTTVPEPPEAESYPTPSGWIPQKESATQWPYYVRRTRNHMMPVYMLTKAGGSQHITKIGKIDGDIWAFDTALKKYLQEVLQKEVKTQVHEVARFVNVKGFHIPEITKFLLDKGF